MYLWERPEWPKFRYDVKTLLPALNHARERQAKIRSMAAGLRLEDQGHLIINEALDTSAIEEEFLNPEDVRSSVARKLGLSETGFPDTAQRHSGLVEVIVEATRGFQEALTKEKLWAWQAALFPTGYSGIQKIEVGVWRSGNQDMNIISGNTGKEKIHYTAPPSEREPPEMEDFLEWWESSRDLNGLIRAGIAHLYFESIHPFEDGIGRIARALTDLALAQDEQEGRRLYSISAQILRDKSRYYAILEETQKGDGDITSWLNWFLETYGRSIDYSLTLVSGSLQARAFYSRQDSVALNLRQKKALDKMAAKLPEPFRCGMTNKKYAAINKTSPATAKRDLNDLVQKGVFVPGEGKGRSANYQLNMDWLAVD